MTAFDVTRGDNAVFRGPRPLSLRKLRGVVQGSERNQETLTKGCGGPFVTPNPFFLHLTILLTDEQEGG